MMKDFMVPIILYFLYFLEGITYDISFFSNAYFGFPLKTVYYGIIKDRI